MRHKATPPTRSSNAFLPRLVASIHPQLKLQVFFVDRQLSVTVCAQTVPHPNAKAITNMAVIPQKRKYLHPTSGPLIQRKLKLALHSKRPSTVVSTLPTASKGVLKSKLQTILGKEKAPSAVRKPESQLLANVSSIKACKPSDCNRATLARDILRTLGSPQLLPANLSSIYEYHANASNASNILPNTRYQ